MKKILFVFLFISLIASAQNRQDTIQLLRTTAGFYHLNFSEAEADSLMGNIRAYTNTFSRMHQSTPPNDLLYPFAYNPAPIGFTIPTAQQKINWTIPANISLPKNRNELAFFSIPQLASLIK
ncbi:MAG TPA: hypothetical protein VEY32_04805, partial [Flavisolibacter sp.]|nr:hypothetical protein [Flavisolibacter sp.]